MNALMRNVFLSADTKLLFMTKMVKGFGTLFVIKVHTVMKMGY